MWIWVHSGFCPHSRWAWCSGSLSRNSQALLPHPLRRLLTVALASLISWGFFLLFVLVGDSPLVPALLLSR